jgi:hypothetical protein
MQEKARNIGLFCYPNSEKFPKKMRDDIEAFQASGWI